jgi:hypothetical protein
VADFTWGIRPLELLTQWGDPCSSLLSSGSALS